MENKNFENENVEPEVKVDYVESEVKEEVKSDKTKVKKEFKINPKIAKGLKFAGKVCGVFAVSAIGGLVAGLVVTHK